MRTEIAALVLLSGCAVSGFRDDLASIEARTGHALWRGMGAEAELGLGDDAEITHLLAEPLTAERAVAIGLVRNRSLRAELRELGVARGALLSASLLPNPEGEVEVREAEDAQPLQIELAVEIALTHTLLTPLRVEAARSELEAERVRVAGRVIEAAYAIRRAFYAARAAEERWRIAMRSLDALAASRDAAEMLAAAGNVSGMDVATRVAVYEEARLSAASIELERATSREVLVRAMGLFGDEIAFSLALDAEPIGDATREGELEGRAIEASLALAELRLRAAAVATRVDLARLEGWLPEVSVDVHGEEDGESLEIGGGVTFSIPIFDHGEGTTMAYEAELGGLVERFEGTAIDVRSAVREAHARLEAARLRALHYEEAVLPAWARVVEETRLQYDAMQIGIFELIAALRARLSAELDAASARAEYFIARAALDAILAGQRVDGPASAGGAEPGAGTAPGGGH